MFLCISTNGIICDFSAFILHYANMCVKFALGYPISFAMHYNVPTEIQLFSGGTSLLRGHTIYAVCFSIRRLPKITKTAIALHYDCPIVSIIALCDPAVVLSVAYRQHIQRRNCQRRPAITTFCGALPQKQRQP